MKVYYSIDDYRIYETDTVRLAIVDGWAVNADGSFPVLHLQLNDEETECSMVRLSRQEAVEKHHLKAESTMCGFRLIGSVHNPVHHLRLVADEEQILDVSGQKLQNSQMESGIVFYIDHTYLDENHKASISGWAFSVDGTPVEYSVTDENGNETESKARTYPRIDQPPVNGNSRTGFQISFVTEGNEILHFHAGEYHETFRYAASSAQTDQDSGFMRMLKKVNDSSLTRLKRYYRQHGLLETVKKVIRTARGIDAYHQWFMEHKADEEELQRQRSVSFAYAPLISVVVPVFNPPKKYLEEMVESLRSQTYINWQLCIADGSQENSDARKLLKEYEQQDKRIAVVYLDQNYGISGNTNKALELAEGEYTGLFDHDDLMEPDMLFEIVSCLQEKRHDVIYTDEDKLNSHSGRFESPCFKPDFDLTLIRSENYITHFLTVKTELIRAVGGFHSEYDGSQDFDLTLRCIEKADSIYHIPKVLYHWRMHGSSTAEDPSSKLYCYEAGEKAVRDHLRRSDIKAQVKYAEDPLWGTYRVIYECTHPRITAILQNYESAEKQNACIEQLKKSYDNLEVLIHGNSLNEDIWMASGSYILLLNGCEPLDEKNIEIMAGCCEQNGVSAVAGMVLGADGMIHDSGLIYTQTGVIDAFRGLSRNGPGVFNKAVVTCEFSAVMPSAVMFRKKDWNTLGGFDEAYESDLFFVDYCLKLRKYRRRIVYNPYAVWKKETGNKEQSQHDLALLCSAWKDVLLAGDPYYSCSYDPEKGPYSL